MGNKEKFFIFLLENYARNKNTSAEVVYDEWEKKCATQYIFDMYEQYHQETLEKAYEDIERICHNNSEKSLNYHY